MQFAMAGGGTLDAAMAITAENPMVIAALNSMYPDMSKDSTKKNPFDPGEGNTVRKVIDSLNNTRWKGWGKWEVVYRTDSGRTVTIHFSYDPVNNLFDDFKFKY